MAHLLGCKARLPAGYAWAIRNNPGYWLQQPPFPYWGFYSLILTKRSAA
jgi:hypothetical protein